jgi:hypothetical protein
MPRPKPLAELKGRGIRMSDIEWFRFQEWGGAARLREVFSYSREHDHPGDKLFNKKKFKEKND